MACETDARVAVCTPYGSIVASCWGISFLVFLSLGPFFDGLVHDSIHALLQLFVEKAAPAAAVGHGIPPAL